MNTIQKKAAAKQIVTEMLDLEGKGAQIGNSEHVIAVEVEGEMMYVGVTLTAKDTKGTKETENRPARAAFDLDSAVAAFEQEKLEAAAAAAAKAAAKAAKVKVKAE